MKTSEPDLQDARRESEERCRSILHQATLPMMPATLEGSHVLTNRAMCFFRRQPGRNARTAADIVQAKGLPEIGLLWQRLITGAAL